MHGVGHKIQTSLQYCKFCAANINGKFSGHCLVLDTLLGIEGATLSYSVRFNWWLNFNDTACLCTLLELNFLFLLFDFHNCLTINFLQCCFRTSQKHGYHRFLLFYHLADALSWNIAGWQALCFFRSCRATAQFRCIVNYKPIQLVKVASISLVPMPSMPFIWFNQYAVNFWLLMRNIFIFSYLKWNPYFLVISFN